MEATHSDTLKNDSKTIVLFGITGDLSKKKLLPAFGNIAARGLDVFSVIGVGRSALSAEEQDFLVGKLRTSLSTSPHPGNAHQFVEYINGEYGASELYKELESKIFNKSSCDVYISLPPFSYKDVLKGFGNWSADSKQKLTLYFEKPFGLHGEEARELFELAQKFELNIFSIDHYKAKYATRVLESVKEKISTDIFSKDCILTIQTSIIEKTDASARGSFYDATGALKDVFQNHMLQVANKVTDVFDCLSPLMEGKNMLQFLAEGLGNTLTLKNVVRAQYDGYTQTKGVNPESQTETFFSFSIPILNKIELLFVSGKGFSTVDSSLNAILNGRHIIDAVFSGNEDISSSELVINEAKKEVIKKDAYEVIFESILHKDSSVFVSKDDIICSWIITEFIKAELAKVPLLTYQLGSDTVPK